MGLCLILAFMRLFQYAQYNDRLNILTETVRMAAGDLLGVVVLGLIVVGGFAMAAHMLFGDNIPEFRHLTASVTTMLQILASGETDQFDDMQALHVWEARILIFFYFLLAWLILLNMILAIITGSFTSVQEANQQVKSWDINALWDELTSFVGASKTKKDRVDDDREKPSTFRKFLWQRFIGKKHGQNREEARRMAGDGVDDDQSLATSFAGTIPEDGNNERGNDLDDVAKVRRVDPEMNIKIVQLLRSRQHEMASKGHLTGGAESEAKAADAVLKQERFRELVTSEVEGVSEEAVSEVYKKAMSDVKASTFCVTQGERWAQGVSDSLNKAMQLGGALSKLELTVQDIPDTHKKVQDTNRKMVETADTLSKLVKEDYQTLKTALDELGKQAQTLDQMQAKLKEASAEVHSDKSQVSLQGLLSATKDLKSYLTKLRMVMDESTKKIIHDVRRGTMWGPPGVEALPKVIPLEVEPAQRGRGVVEEVRRYAFPSFYPVEGPVDPTDLQHKDPPMERQKQKKVTWGEVEDTYEPDDGSA